MNLLALETATESCSAALLVDGRVLVRSELAPRRHAELLLTMCEELLAEAGLARRDLEAIAVGAGPGAFTGVRLAISAAQGIALALDIPVIPVSSLAALAMQAPVNGASILAVIDARMGEIYAGAFRRTGDGLVEPIDSESVRSADALTLVDAAAWNVVGSGWATYAEILRTRLPTDPLWVDGARYPQAGDVAQLAAPIARAGLGVSAEHAQPVYLRNKVALTVAEQRTAREIQRSGG